MSVKCLCLIVEQTLHYFEEVPEFMVFTLFVVFMNSLSDIWRGSCRNFSDGV